MRSILDQYCEYGTVTSLKKTDKTLKQVGAELWQAQYRLVHLGLYRFPTKLLLKYNFKLLLTRKNNVGIKF